MGPYESSIASVNVTQRSSRKPLTPNQEVNVGAPQGRLKHSQEMTPSRTYINDIGWAMNVS